MKAFEPFHGQATLYMRKVIGHAILVMGTFEFM